MPARALDRHFTRRMLPVAVFAALVVAAVPPLAARHAHEEFNDTPVVDKGFFCFIQLFMPPSNSATFGTPAYKIVQATRALL